MKSTAIVILWYVLSVGLIGKRLKTISPIRARKNQMKNVIIIRQDNPYYTQQLTKWSLMRAFMSLSSVTITDSSGIDHNGKISSIQLEDGSGSSFNIQTQGGQNFHVRTID